MLKHITLILSLIVLTATPVLADDDCPPGWWCVGGKQDQERWAAERRHEELMEELQRPRQCFTQRDVSGRPFTWCN